MSVTLPPGCAARFVPEKLLGQGGFGAVWLARQKGLDRPIALKVLAPDRGGDPLRLERFRAEARVTASLAHPAIVKVLDHDVEDDVPWIAYEYLSGPTLEALIGEGLPVGRALEAVTQIAGALGAAHEVGVVHRDVKAANVLESEPGRFKLADFGIAKWTADDSVHTQTGVVLGTPSHMAPELLTGAAPSARTDLYALGVVLYHALAGRLPFGGSSAAGIIRAVLEEAPPPLRAVRPDVPPGVEMLTGRLLAKDPGARPRDAAELLAELEALRESGASAVRVRTSGRISRPAVGVTRPISIAGVTAPSVVAAPTDVTPRVRTGGRWAPVALVALGLVAVGVLRRGSAVESPPPPPASVASPSPTASVEAPPGRTGSLDAFDAALKESQRLLNLTDNTPAYRASVQQTVHEVGVLLDDAAAGRRDIRAVLHARTLKLVQALLAVLLCSEPRDNVPFLPDFTPCEVALRKGGKETDPPLVRFVRRVVLGQLVLKRDTPLNVRYSTDELAAAFRVLNEVEVDWRESPDGLEWRAWAACEMTDGCARGKGEWDTDPDPRVPGAMQLATLAGAQAYEVFRMAASKLPSAPEGRELQPPLVMAEYYATGALGKLASDTRLGDAHRRAVDEAAEVAAIYRALRGRGFTLPRPKELGLELLERVVGGRGAAGKRKLHE